VEAIVWAGSVDEARERFASLWWGIGADIKILSVRPMDDDLGDTIDDVPARPFQEPAQPTQADPEPPPAVLTQAHVDTILDLADKVESDASQTAQDAPEPPPVVSVCL